MTASLYGIHHSNRNFSDPYYWGKNQFNSSFPVALACYMRDKNIDCNFIELVDKHRTTCSEKSFEYIFNTGLKNSEIKFMFESRYEPFSEYCQDELKPIDLVIKSNTGANEFIRPLEIKLTTLPDNTTAILNEDEYGCELVIRNPTMRYVALSMAHACREHFPEIREIFEHSCSSVRSWDNLSEMLGKRESILQALEYFLDKFRNFQAPLLMQPVWKTVGKSADLAQNCLDVFVWTDFALTRLFMKPASLSQSDKITRHQRSGLRLARCLYEVSSRGKVYQQPIYDGMTYDTLNDKEFATSGSVTNQFMRCPRLTKPSITKEDIKGIILGGGQNYLSPERRFDAIIYFSKELFDD